MEVRILHKQGKSIHAIARELSVSRGAVRKFLRQPGLSAGYGPRKGRASKLDPFKDYLQDRIRNAAPRRLPATVYLRELRALGYDGGITILKDWLLSQRPVQETPAIIRFETPPGKQAQVDWTSIRRGKNKLSAFVGTLGFSRLSFVWFCEDEKFGTLVEAHERFFDAISGTPQTILYDNMKTVLIDRNVYGPGKHRFHAGFREFAKHHGFSPRIPNVDALSSCLSHNLIMGKGTLNPTTDLCNKAKYLKATLAGVLRQANAVAETRCNSSRMLR